MLQISPAISPAKEVYAAYWMQQHPHCGTERINQVSDWPERQNELQQFTSNEDLVQFTVLFWKPESSHLHSSVNFICTQTVISLSAYTQAERTYGLWNLKRCGTRDNWRKSTVWLESYIHCKINSCETTWTPDVWKNTVTIQSGRPCL